MLFTDVGRLIDFGTLSVKEIAGAVKTLDESTKYKLLTCHHKPRRFQVTYQDGNNRAFQETWFKDRSWLVYSEVMDGALCMPCLLFVPQDKRESLGVLVNRPFRRWCKWSAQEERHIGRAYHVEAMNTAQSFKKRIENPEATVSAMIDKQRADNIQRNRDIITHVFNSVIYLGRQGLAYRCSSEKLDGAGNKGNFLELILLLTEYDDTLKKHVDEARKTSYLSPTIQNQIIQLLGQEIIRPAIISKAKQAQYYSLICDESSSAKKEYLSLAIRFVFEQEIREEFLGFIPVIRTSGQFLADTIMETLEKFGLDIMDCRGQGYDGAAAMRSDRCGVQSVIRDTNPKALYFHCASHCMNLVFVHSCSDVHIKTAMAKLSEVS